MTRPLVRALDVRKYFPVGRALWGASPRAWLRAVDGVSLEIGHGTTVGLVGESGCGKSTFGRLVIHLLEPTSGSIEIDGLDVTHLRGRALRPLRRRFQMVFQDPMGSLDPRVRIGESVAEPLLIAGEGDRRDHEARARELLELVGIGADSLHRYPHEFSGGQRQRICIARALVLNPDFIVADEPVSALDVSVRAQIVNLFQDVQERFGLSYLFISHDLGVVGHVANRIVVMYMGRIVEDGESDAILRDPQHPYTKSLIAAVPQARPRQSKRPPTADGDLPNPMNIPMGCAFHMRCPLAAGRCREEAPALRTISPGRRAACHFI